MTKGLTLYSYQQKSCVDTLRYSDYYALPALRTPIYDATPTWNLFYDSYVWLRSYYGIKEWPVWWWPVKPLNIEKQIQKRNGSYALITAVVPFKEQPILTSFSDWSFATNYWLALDCDHFDTVVDKFVAEYGNYFKEKPLKNPEGHRIITDSWAHIIPRRIYHPKKDMQVCTRCIKREWVTNIEILRHVPHHSKNDKG